MDDFDPTEPFDAGVSWDEWAAMHDDLSGPLDVPTDDEIADMARRAGFDVPF